MAHLTVGEKSVHNPWKGTKEARCCGDQTRCESVVITSVKIPGVTQGGTKDIYLHIHINAKRIVTTKHYCPVQLSNIQLQQSSCPRRMALRVIFTDFLNFHLAILNLLLLCLLSLLNLPIIRILCCQCGQITCPVPIHCP